MAEQPEARRGRIAYEPALDGLRGFALFGILSFHAEFTWAKGGFLPLPTFFVLSGFLITSLFLAEWEGTGTVSLRAFWARRLRRLMPGALLTLGAMSLFGLTVATPDQLARLRGDVFWTLAYMANWRFLIADTAYTQLFQAPSPLQHFWSLAVEEQFYLTFPLVALLGLRVGRGSRVGLGWIFAAIALGSLAVSCALAIGGASVDRLYYGTDTRGSELAVGCLLAAILHGRPIDDPKIRRWIQIAGALGLAVMTWLWTFVDLEWRWLYMGGLVAYSLLTAVVIAAAVQPGGFVRTVLSGRFIRWVGKISYGVYLFHWPIYLILTPERTGLDQGFLFLLRLGVTFGLAALSYEYFESPIRTRKLLTGWRPLVATPVAIVAVALAAVAVTTGVPGDADGNDLEVVSRDFEARRASSPQRVDEPPPSRTRTLPRIAVYGDSTAVVLGAALDEWYLQSDIALSRFGVAQLGCGLLRKGAFLFRGREIAGRPEHCGDRGALYRASIESERPDVAVVSLGPWDVLDRKFPGDRSWRAPSDKKVVAHTLNELVQLVDLLSADGALVVWLTSPIIKVLVPGTNMPYRESDPSRMHQLNRMIFALEKRRPGAVRVIDLAGYMRGLPGGELDPDYRPDGVHMNAASSRRVVDDWLAQKIVRVYHEDAKR